jgi:hypothetical protein
MRAAMAYRESGCRLGAGWGWGCGCGEPCYGWGCDWLGLRLGLRLELRLGLRLGLTLGLTLGLSLRDWATDRDADGK